MNFSTGPMGNHGVGGPLNMMLSTPRVTEEVISVSGAG